MRFLILFLSFLCFANAFNKEDIISDVFVSTDSINYTNIKDLSGDSDEEYQQFHLKTILNRKVIKDDMYYLRFSHNYDTVKDINVNAIKDDNEFIVEITKDIQDEIIVHIDSSHTKLESFLNLEVLTQEEYKGVLDSEKLYFGLAYGIIFCAFLYNFILFLYNKEKSFLYYSFLQLSLLLFLITNVMTLDIFKPLYSYINLLELWGQLALIFAVLFNRAFLDSKNNIPRVDKVLLAMLVFLLVDLVFLCVSGRTVLNNYIPTSLIIAILVLSSLLVYKQGYKIAIFYILGWSIIFICVFLIEYGVLPVSDIYALFIGLPLESLILSFSLGYKMKQLEKEKIMHEQMLIHQNKLASMGQMLNNIAHQYRQPLTHLGYILMNINSAHKHGELDSKYLEKKMKEANDQLEFMSDTIDNFKDFYKPKNQKELFYIHKSVSSAVFILKPILEEKNINIQVDVSSDTQILGYENEYSQVVLNLISNAMDTLVENQIENAKIEVILKGSSLYVKDNAIGVPKDLEEKIFEPYFTTKDKSSGIGLYMSMLIMQEHFNGNLYLENSKEGATFVLEV